MHCIILVGIAGSGKSTHAQRLKDDYIVVNPDTLRYWILGDINDQSQNWQIHMQADALAALYLNSGFDVIIDATNCNVRLLQERIERLERMSLHSIDITVRVIDTPFVECAMRIVDDLASGKHRANVPLAALVKQWRQLQELKKDIVKVLYHSNVNVINGDDYVTSD